MPDATEAKLDADARHWRRCQRSVDECQRCRDIERTTLERIESRLAEQQSGPTN
jgi:hypothetical protein